MTTHFGFSVSMALANSDQRPERVPVFMPRRRPARDTSWQGNPPARMSTGSTVAQSIRVTSPWLGTSGWWKLSTFDGALSNSENHAGREPNTASTAMPKPPTPANSSPDVSGAVTA